MKTNQIIAIFVLLLVVGGAAFFGGTKYQQRKNISGFNRQNTGIQGRGQGMGQGPGQDGNVAKNRGQVAGFRQTIGEIINIDDKSITVKLADGSSKIVLLSDSLTVSQATSAAKTDLKVGVKIAVSGDQNTDGSIIGRNIEINPRVATITPTVKQ